MKHEAPYRHDPLPRADDKEESEDDKKQTPLAMKLLESRSILLSGPINSELAAKIVAQLLILDADDPEKPIKVFINSPGGAVDSGFAIYDMMRFVQAPVHTICTGLAASAATVILMGADKGHRYSLPNTRFMLHQPSSGMQGQASDIEITAREIIRLRQRINELLAEGTGQTVERIFEDLNRDYWMPADAAVEYGLVDTVVTSASELA